MAQRGDTSALVDQAADALSKAIGQIREAPTQGGLAPMYVQGVILELMACLLDIMRKEGEEDDAPIPRQIMDEHRYAESARTILMDNLINPPTIGDLARQVGLSQRRLNEVFRDTFGAAPYQCLKDWRLDKAKFLLERGNMTIKQVAHQMGYTHVSSFTHAYTRRFGNPPSRDSIIGKPAEG